MKEKVKIFINECDNAIDEEYARGGFNEIYEHRKKELEKLGYKLESLMSGTKPPENKKYQITIEVDEDTYKYMTRNKQTGISIRGKK
jgi:hypothetical protein